MDGVSWKGSILGKDTYTTTGTGLALGGAPEKPLCNFSIMVKGTGAGASTWTVILEGSLDGVNFTTILTHATADSDGVTKSLTAITPYLYFRTRCTGVSLGSATNIVATVLAVS